ncbi:MAG: hypothetical protein R6V46_03935 [Desulfatiglandaceae bacterium]
MRVNQHMMRVTVMLGICFLFFTNLAFPQFENLLFEFGKQNSTLLSPILREYQQDIAIERPAAIILTPTRQFPIKDFDSLEKASRVQALIGSFYTIQPFENLNLKPGLYGIILEKTGNTYQAIFVDSKGNEVNKTTASVTKSDGYHKEPTAKFRFNSPGAEICWDNICVVI